MDNMRNLSIATIGAAVIALGTISTGQAQPITTFTSRTNWNAAISGSSTFLENFESFTSDIPFRITPVDVGEFTLFQAGENPNFRNLIEVPPFEFDDNNGTNHASMFTNFGATTVDMIFDTPVFAWGADFFGADETTGERLDLDLMLDMGGIFVTIPVTTNNGFFGFVTNPAEQIRKLTFVSRTNNPGQGGEGFGLDNVAGAQSQAVPEPTSMSGILVFAVLATGSVLKRKQQQKESLRCVIK
jgi:hypothetical protein